MLEFLNSLTMEAVIVVLGSLISIIIGIFGYLRVRPPSNPADSLNDLRHLIASHSEQIDKLHSRISTARESNMENRGDVRSLLNQVAALEKALSDHEKRDIQDFKSVQQKVDKIMDIVIQILQDDKL